MFDFFRDTLTEYLIFSHFREDITSLNLCINEGDSLT